MREVEWESATTPCCFQEDRAATVFSLLIHLVQNSEDYLSLDRVTKIEPSHGCRQQPGTWTAQGGEGAWNCPRLCSLPMRWCDRFLGPFGARHRSNICFDLLFLCVACTLENTRPWHKMSCTCTSIFVYMAAPSSDHYFIPHSLRFAVVHAPDLQHH